ncbi:MAG: cation diffusion facilitator family transporter [Thermoproteota archaeon]|nr:cation diffusion facilitator family transporter [Thermoproteota archaeon]
MANSEDKKMAPLNSVRIRKLKTVIAITVVYLFVQIIFGFLTGSLALLADAGHMLTDVGGLVMSLFAIIYSQKPSTSTHTYGFYRTEILATLINSLILILISFFVIYEAYRRILSSHLEVDGFPMLVIASVGLILNIASMKILQTHNHAHMHAHSYNPLSAGKRQHPPHQNKNLNTDFDNDLGKGNRQGLPERIPAYVFKLFSLAGRIKIIRIKNSHSTSNIIKDNSVSNSSAGGKGVDNRDESLNMQSASLEVLSDALGSIGVIAAALIIQTTHFTLADPLVSIGLALFILPRTWFLLKKAIHILLEGAPSNIPYEEVKNAILQIKGVTGLFDLRIWTITSGMHALSAHVVILDITKSQSILREINSILERRYGITNTTIQIELYHV